MIREDEVVAEVSVPAAVAVTPPSRVRWGAIIAGLLVIAAVGWVLSVLGSALGLTVVDSTEGEAATAGFGIGLVIYMVLSWWLAYFLGAFVATRLSNTLLKETATLQSVTLWACGATVTFLIGFFGVTGIATGTVKAMGAAGKVAGATLGAAGGAAAAAENGNGAASPFPNDVTNGVMAAVKREAARVASEAGEKGGENINPERIRLAMEELDADTTTQIAIELAMGRPQSAKDILTARTNLSDQEVDAIITGANRAVEQKVAEAKAKLEEAKEAALSYAQAALWTTFIGAGVALLASILGGMAGIAALRHRVVESRRVEPAMAR